MLKRFISARSAIAARDQATEALSVGSVRHGLSGEVVFRDRAIITFHDRRDEVVLRHLRGLGAALGDDVKLPLFGRFGRDLGIRQTFFSWGGHQ